MKSFDFEAVVIEGAVYCVECVGEGTDLNGEDVSPIFADSEWDHYPTCDGCGAQHEYVSLTDEGRAALGAPDAFVRAYLECAVWACTDEHERPLDDTYSADDFAVEADNEAGKECDDFWAANRADLQSTGASAAQLGHDFYLSRNGHGTGFWDRGYAAGDRLHAAAKVYGTATAYAGDDGQLYFHG